MEIIDMSPEYEDTYCLCLEDWSDEMKEAGDYKRLWLQRKKKEGLRVKLARSDAGDIVGMIHYVPVDRSPVTGLNLYYIYCIWVHGYSEGVGNYQKKGIGRMLLSAAEEDCRQLGADGIAAWGVRLPFFMRSGWFRKNGYRKADRDGIVELVWKPFSDGAEAPGLVRPRKKPAAEPGCVTVTCFRNGWCPAQNLSCERMRRAAEKYGEKVRFSIVDTDDRETMLEWGIQDALYVDGRRINTGPPPSYEKLERILKRKAGKLS